MGVRSAHDQGIFRKFVGEAIGQRLALARRRRAQAHAGSDTRQQAALIFGAGASPGIGAAVAARCAAGGMYVIVTGRNSAKIQQTVQTIQQAGHPAEALTVDVANVDAIQAAFARVHALNLRLELVVHNAGTNRPTPFMDISPEGLEKRWISDCRSGFVIGQQAIPTMLEQADMGRGRGTLIFTGASASLRGRAGFAPFAQAKAGLRMLAQALAREFGPEGIHVAHTIIDGVVDGERLRQAIPDYLKAQGEQGSLDPAAIAESYWAIAQQQRCAWTHELDLRPFREHW